MVIGNHDRLTVQNHKAMEYFASVEKMDCVIDNGRKVSMCHFPVAEWNGKRRGGYHVYGHLHGRRNAVYEFMSRFDGALNAGCMINGYCPVTLDELIENNLRFRSESGGIMIQQAERDYCMERKDSSSPLFGFRNSFLSSIWMEYSLQ